jgi:hypothetical protein
MYINFLIFLIGKTMINIDLTKLEDGINLLQAELTVLETDGYTKFFHSLSQNVREEGQKNGVNFEEIYKNSIQSMKDNIKESKSSLKKLKHYLEN